MPVKIVKADKYDVKSLEHLIKNAIKELGLDLKNKKSAILKPNIVIPATSKSAIITHPSVTEAMVNVLEENGFERIFIGEGAGLGADESRVFDQSGYNSLATKKNLRVVNLNKAHRTELEWEYGTIKIPQIILDCDLYINLPKMKTHGQTVVTLAMKNQKGLLSGSDKKRFHTWGLHQPLVELAKVITPDLNIVDAIKCMEGEGPLNGKKKKVGALVIGENILEVDMACCLIMDIDYETVEHIKEGIEQEIGPENPTLLDDISEIKTTFKRANTEYGNILNVYSRRNPYACSMCIDSFTLAVKSSIKDPKNWVTFIPKFAYYAIFKRIDIVQGKNAEIPDVEGKVICLGDCTKDIACENNLLHIKGCPPKSEDILKGLIIGDGEASSEGWWNKIIKKE